MKNAQHLVSKHTITDYKSRKFCVFMLPQHGGAGNQKNLPTILLPSTPLGAQRKFPDSAPPPLLKSGGYTTHGYVSFCQPPLYLPRDTFSQLQVLFTTKRQPAEVTPTCAAGERSRPDKRDD